MTESKDKRSIKLQIEDLNESFQRSLIEPIIEKRSEAASEKASVKAILETADKEELKDIVVRNNLARLQLINQILRDRRFLKDGLNLAKSILNRLGEEKQEIESKYGPGYPDSWSRYLNQMIKRIETWIQELEKIFCENSNLERSLFEFLDKKSPLVGKIELKNVYLIGPLDSQWQVELLRVSREMTQLNADLYQCLRSTVNVKDPRDAIQSLESVIVQGDLNKLQELKDRYCGGYEILEENVSTIRSCLKAVEEKLDGLKFYLDRATEYCKCPFSRWQTLENANNCIVARNLIEHSTKLVKEARQDLERKDSMLVGYQLRVSR